MDRNKKVRRLRRRGPFAEGPRGGARDRPRLRGGLTPWVGSCPDLRPFEDPDVPCPSPTLPVPHLPCDRNQDLRGLRSCSDGRTETIPILVLRPSYLYPSPTPPRSDRTSYGPQEGPPPPTSLRANGTGDDRAEGSFRRGVGVGVSEVLHALTDSKRFDTCPGGTRPLLGSDICVPTLVARPVTRLRFPSLGPDGRNRSTPPL